MVEEPLSLVTAFSVHVMKRECDDMWPPHHHVRTDASSSVRAVRMNSTHQRCPPSPARSRQSAQPDRPIPAPHAHTRPCIKGLSKLQAQPRVLAARPPRHRPPPSPPPHTPPAPRCLDKRTTDDWATCTVSLHDICCRDTVTASSHDADAHPAAHRPTRRRRRVTGGARLAGPGARTPSESPAMPWLRSLVRVQVLPLQNPWRSFRV